MDSRRLYEGNDLAEALAAASAGSGIPEAELQYELVETGRPGLFGLGARKVRIRLEPPIEIPDLTDLIREPIPMELEPTAPEAGTSAPAEPAEEPVAAAEPGRRGRGRRDRRERRERKERGAEGRERSSRRGRRRRDGKKSERGRPGEGRAATAGEPVEPPAEAGSIAETLGRIFERIGADLTAEPIPGESGVTLRIVGNDLAELAAQDGERLTALQFLVNRMARRAWPGVGRIQLVPEGTEGTREEDLVEMTHEIARQVEATGQPRRLRPMNAYERRLVHLTVRKYPSLDSRSEGGGATKRVRIFRPEPTPP